MTHPISLLHVSHNITTCILFLLQDLKKYHFYYWFAFPCVCPDADFTLNAQPQILSDKYSADQVMFINANLIFS